MEYPFELVNRKSKVGHRNIVLEDKDKKILDEPTGELDKFEYRLCQPIFLDGTEFVKIYDTLPLMKLNPCGMRVFLFVISILKFGGQFYFKYADCMKVTGMSKAMVYRGLRELEKNNIIKKDDMHLYYINWNIAYRGNRDKKDEKENR